MGNQPSSHGEREGEAPAAWLLEGATPLRGQAQAPVIDATDRQIDRLVYELYGLAEEEIAIVERIE